MLPANQALIIIAVMLLFGFANVFFGRDIFRPLLLIYGFTGGAVLVNCLFAQTRNSEPNLIAILIVGSIFAILSYIIFYLGIAMLGVGVGALFSSMLAYGFHMDMPELVILVIVVICGGCAIIFHHYVLMFATALGGSTIIAQAVYLFFPDTRARFSFGGGLEFVEVSNGALFIGSIIIVGLTILGTYIQWKSHQEEEAFSY